MNSISEFETFQILEIIDHLLENEKKIDLFIWLGGAGGAFSQYFQWPFGQFPPKIAKLSSLAPPVLARIKILGLEGASKNSLVSLCN